MKSLPNKAKFKQTQKHTAEKLSKSYILLI